MPRMSSWHGLLWVAAIVGSSAVASADPAPASQTADTDQATPAATQKRTLPNYDGRAEPATTAGDALLWLPRIAFFPLYLVSEYMLRKPIELSFRGAQLVGAQRIFAGGGAHKLTLLPTVAAQFGFRPSIGLYFAVNNIGFQGHQLRARGAFGGIGFYRLKLKQRVVFDGGVQRIGIYGSFRQRRDDIFAGIGADVRYNLTDVARYTTRELEGGTQYDFNLDLPTSLTAGLAFRDVDYAAGASGGPALTDLVAAGALEAPARFEDGYTTFRMTLRGALDSRDTLDDREPWLRLEGTVSSDISLRDPTQGSWFNYGVEAGGGFDAFAPLRRVSLSLAGRFADPIGEQPVPFSALAEVGSQRHLRAFAGGALRGRSAIMATAIYRWPIWTYLNGSFHVASGNVFDTHLRDFGLEKLRLSFGPGISTNMIDDSMIFDLGVAFGTETFANGAEISATRVGLSISEGF